MLRICRAEDGEVFQVDSTLWDIENNGNLEQFLQEETGVNHEAILAYLSNGQRLMNENIRELAGAQDDTIFVFNKFYLDLDLHQVLKELRLQPQLQPPIEDTISSTPPFRPHQLAAAYLRIAQDHYENIAHLAETVRQQSTALSIASNSLDLNILDVSETFEPFAQNAHHTFTMHSRLLASLETDLAAVTSVRIHPVFLSVAARRAVESGERARTLGDYVSNEKMRQVAEGCARLSDGLKTRFIQAQECMDRLRDGADQIRTTLQTNRILESADSIERRARDASEKVKDIAARINGSNSDSLLPELKYTDSLIRKDVENMTDIKNLSTELCIGALRRISVLNADLVQLPTLMSSLQSDLRVKSSFSHIQRLHGMLYAYGATLVEIVRRREFSRFFYARAQTILEVMARLTAAERRRRQIYRGEVHGQLPFETRGMDDSVPSIDFTPSGGKEGDADSNYVLERSDVETFMQFLNELEKKLSRQDDRSLVETRDTLQKLIDKMNGIESSFDKVVEKTLLSSSRLSLSRRRLTEADEFAFQELADKVTVLEREKQEREAAIEKERDTYKAEIARLKSELNASSETADVDRVKLEREVHSLRAQNESESQTRVMLENRHTEMLADIDSLEREKAGALAELTSKTQEIEVLRRELAQVRQEHDETKQLEATHAQRITQLLRDQTETLRVLEEARARGDDLTQEIENARLENAEVHRALLEGSEQREKLLKAQALEHERKMRDHIAEADGDRAVLEQQFFETRAQLEEKDRALKEARTELYLCEGDLRKVREELQNTEHDLRETRHTERVLRNDLSEGRASQSDYEQRIADRDRLIAQILDVAIAFRDAHNKAISILQPLSIHPAVVLRNGAGAGANPSESTVLTPPRFPTSPLREDATPIDPTDPAGALEILREYDLDAYSETVEKVSSVVRKWQKQCREYRDRAKGKIAFRNFAKGDLALFLPTRNSVSKPWAAFNVSFPHYFLNATGRLAEQLKTREWIVARITSISEKIATANDPESNPYSLNNGIKYYMLEVEDWTKPGTEAAKRRKSSNRQNQEVISSSPPLERPISPPLGEVTSQSGTSTSELGPTRSPNSHLFPTMRSRSNSASAGPSSLSKLLAQAGEAPNTATPAPLETIPATPPEPARTRSPSPPPRINGPPPPSPSRKGTIAHSPNMPSPLRPGSRASSSSRLSFSGGRIATFPRGSTAGQNTSKAAPTTALSAENPVNSPPASSISSSDKNQRASIQIDMRSQHDRQVSSPGQSSTPSPTQSVTEGMTSILPTRRRTTSDHIKAGTGVPKAIKRPSMNLISSPSNGGVSAVSSLASFTNTFNLNMFRRRQTAEAPLPTSKLSKGRKSGDNQNATGVSTLSSVESDPESVTEVIPEEAASSNPTQATELLRRFEN